MAQDKDDTLYDGSTDVDYHQDYNQSAEDDIAYAQDTADEWTDDIDSEFADDAGTRSEPAPRKKKSNLVLYVTLGVVALGAGVFFLGRGAPSNSDSNIVVVDGVTEPVVDAGNASEEVHTPVLPDSVSVSSETQNGTQNDAPQDVALTDSPVPAIPEAQGLMANPELLNQMEGQTESTAPATTVQASPNVVKTEGDTANVNNLVETITPDVKPVSDFPTADSIKKTEVTSDSPVPEVDVSPEKSDAPVLDTAQDTKQDTKTDSSVEIKPESVETKSELDAALEKIATLEKTVSEKEAALETQKAKLQEQVSPSSEVAALQSKIDDLERKLANSNRIPERAVFREDGTETIKVQKPKSAPVVAPQWVLKGANSNKAILSDKKTGDLKTIAVGQTVLGLGRIVSISETGAGWVVKGTSSSLSE